MVYPQRAVAEDTFQVVPPIVAAAATAYQRARSIEKEQLALMARHDLLGDWSDDVRATVLEARARIHEAREARARFRAQVEQFVMALRTAREPLSAVLRHTRSMVQLLERTGAIDTDDGWLEAEVLEWAIETYES